MASSSTGAGAGAGPAARSRPNVLITGTPGVGKTSLCDELVKRLSKMTILGQPLHYQHINVGQLVNDNKLYSEWDKQFDCAVIDEDKLCDELEEPMNDADGGKLLDSHVTSFFPLRWFDLVIVLRTDNTVLYNRLEARGYPDTKIQENVTSEIMEQIAAEVREDFDSNIIVELPNDTVDQMEDNLNRSIMWIVNWIKNNHEGGAGVGAGNGTSGSDGIAPHTGSMAADGETDMN